MARPSTRREWASSSAARYSQSSQVAIGVLSPTPNRSRAGAAKSRHQVWGGGGGGVGDGGARAPPTVAPGEPRRAHQPGDPAGAAADAARAEGRPDARHAVGAPTLLSDLRDLRRQRLVRVGAGRDPATRPRVVPRAANVEYSAEDGDRIVGLLRRDEPLAAHKVSRAQEAAALRKISRSCWRISTSRRKRRNSSRSPVVGSPGCPCPSSTSARLIQPRSARSETPRSWASWGRPSPLVFASATASARNAGG